jgi:hypothetical protein
MATRPKGVNQAAGPAYALTLCTQALSTGERLGTDKTPLRPEIAGPNGLLEKNVPFGGSNVALVGPIHVALF